MQRLVSGPEESEEESVRRRLGPASCIGERRFNSNGHGRREAGIQSKGV